MAPFFDTTEVLSGKATVYRRSEGGSFYFRYWVAAEKKRVSQSLKTKDLGAAVQLATERVLEAMSKERSGERVISGTLSDAISAYAEKQRARLSRGEIRGDIAVKGRVRTLINQLQRAFGLETPLSSMTQAKWDTYLEVRDNVKLSTLHGELKLIKMLMKKHGVKLGAPCVPDFSYVSLPPEQRSKRFECLSEEQFEELAEACIWFMGFEDEENRLYKRSFHLNGHERKGEAGRGGGRSINQKLEAHRRKVLYRLVMVLAASGMRPHEAAGEFDKSLRWCDVIDPGFSVETKQLSTQTRPVRMLNVRKETKTGKRTVPAACGDHLDKMKLLCADQKSEAMVFQDLDGSPIPMNTMRLYFQEVVSRCPSINIKTDFYTLRHLWATRRLREGVPVATVALAMGNSVAVVSQTYSHVCLSEEGMVRALYEQQLKQG